MTSVSLTLREQCRREALSSCTLDGRCSLSATSILYRSYKSTSAEKLPANLHPVVFLNVGVCVDNYRSECEYTDFVLQYRLRNLFPFSQLDISRKKSSVTQQKTPAKCANVNQSLAFGDQFLNCRQSTVRKRGRWSPEKKLLLRNQTDWLIGVLVLNSYNLFDEDERRA